MGRKNVLSSPIKSDRDKSEKSNVEQMNGNKEIGTSQLMNCHQNPRNAYYYGPPQQQQYMPPMIVTGPSNDIRNMQYSDSYNDSYGGVIYEESPHKNGKYDHETI